MGKVKCFTVYIVSVVFFIYSVSTALGQCPTSDFSLPTSSCLNENTYVTNTSANGTSYIWDFCSNVDMDVVPGYGSVSEENSFSAPYDIEIVKEAGDYHGFVINFNSGDLMRLDFGDSIGLSPNYTNLGNGGVMNNPIGLTMFESGSSWIGYALSLSDNALYLIDFGTSITNEPVITDITESLILNRPVSLEQVIIEGGYHLFIANQGITSLNRLDFSDGDYDTFTESTISLSSSTDHADITFVKECNEWYGFLVSRNGALVNRLDFGSDISITTPIETVITGSLGVTLQRPTGITILIEGGEYYAYMTSRDNSLYQMSFGSDITSLPTGIDLGNLNGANKDWGITSIKDRGEWNLIGVNFGSSMVNRYRIENECGVSIYESTDQNPVVQYSSSGTYTIQLYAEDENGNNSYHTESIIVSTNIAPNISFTIDDSQCLNIPNTFTSTDDGGLTYSWDFNNDGTPDSTEPNPSYIFGTTGDHVVKLTVDDGTCTNINIDTVGIFPVPPTPAYTYPGGLLCSNQDILFTNTTDESAHVGATISYDWDFNAEGNLTTDNDASFNFTDGGDKNVSLTMNILGCSSVIPYSETLSVTTGPSIAFDYQDKCFGDLTQFTNNTTGENIISYYWDFGEGNSFDVPAPGHKSYEFGSTGDKEVYLKTENQAGCIDSLISIVTIDAKPVADFDMGVACERAEVEFKDLSTVSNANVEDWDWDFGGLGNSTQKDPIHLFDDAASYDITLVVESTYGCVDEVTKTLNVLSAPVAAFDVDLGCLDSFTTFNDASTSDMDNPIVSWFWVINGTDYPDQNPQEVFNSPGEYPAILTVELENRCSNSISQNFTIHELPVVAFSTDNACDNEYTQFTDESTSATTSIVTRTWTFDELGTGNSNPAAFNFSEAGNYEITLSVVDDIGCESMGLQTVTINPSPISRFDASEDLGPPPMTIDFSNTSIEANSYLWQFNDANQSTSVDQHTSFTYDELGDYEAELIAYTDLGCSDTFFLPIIIAEPILDLELLHISQEVDQDKVFVTLTVQNSGNVKIHGFDIKIDLEDNSTVYETYTETVARGEQLSYPLNFTFSNTNSNINDVCFTLIENESDYDDINLLNNEGCVNFGQEVVVKNTFPNPATSESHQVRLDMILPAKAPVQIFLMDATGSELSAEIVTNTNAGLNSFFIDVYSLRQGLYFIKVIYDGVESTQKLVRM